MRRFLLVAVMCGAASVAQAADMPDLPFLRGSFTEGLSATSVNWQGFYVGGQVGYGTSKMNFTGSTGPSRRAHGPPEMSRSSEYRNGRLGQSADCTATGFGGFVGYNSQWDDVVIGLELNYMHGKFGGSQTGRMSRFFTLPSGDTVGATYEGTARMKISDMGTLRARGGYVCGSFLPYLFAGTALGQADINRTARVFGTQVNPAAAPGFQNVPFDISEPTPSIAI